ncbi:hypothetical protein ACFQ1M_04740 [Sungkyunkwania multivorans]|uniref:DinB family protein n=1 Tax=Sungkyunkwania multivorans TaxID=1173618 RepID=A0ABW3CV28_9FLAO
MKVKGILFSLMSIFAVVTVAQETMSELPYHQIPDAPESYTAGTVAARMVDGLGFRYYWATEGLREKDLEYKPNKESRTTAQTIDHIYGLSKTIINATLKKPNISSEEKELSFEQKRAATLNNFKRAADILRSSDDISQYNMVFQQADGRTSEFPFWNHINGPIADAIWHCGQVVSFRRASGNPFNSKVSLLRGRLRQ